MSDPLFVVLRVYLVWGVFCSEVENSFQRSSSRDFFLIRTFLKILMSFCWSFPYSLMKYFELGEHGVPGPGDPGTSGEWGVMHLDFLKNEIERL